MKQCSIAKTGTKKDKEASKKEGLASMLKELVGNNKKPIDVSKGSILGGIRG